METSYERVPLVLGDIVLGGSEVCAANFVMRASEDSEVVKSAV